MDTAKTKNALPVGVAALTILLVAGVLSVSAQESGAESSSQKVMHQSPFGETHMVFKASHGAVFEALEAGDYEAWLEAISDLPMAEKHSEKITEENFEKMVEAHRLMEEGDHEGARAIMEELDIKPFRIKLAGPLHSEIFGQLTEEQREEVKKVMESEGPEAVKALMEEYGIEKPVLFFRAHPFVDQLTEEQKEELNALKESGATPEEMKAWFEANGIDFPEPPEFAELTEEQKAALKEARESGEHEKMKALMEEYGLPAFGLKHKIFHHEFKELTEEERQRLKDARQEGPEAVKAAREELGLERAEQGDFFFFGERANEE